MVLAGDAGFDDVLRATRFAGWQRRTKRPHSPTQQCQDLVAHTNNAASLLSDTVRRNAVLHFETRIIYRL